MGKVFTIKVWMARLTFLSALFGCWVLYTRGLSDYIILTVVLIFFFGIFSTSLIKLEIDEVIIKKNYFWGIFWLRKKLKYGQIISVTRKEYLIIQNEWWDWLFVETKARWTTAKIVYDEVGIEKNIELKISSADFKSLEKDLWS